MTSNIVVEVVLKVVISLALWLVVAKVFLYVGKKIFKDQSIPKGINIFIL